MKRLTAIFRHWFKVDGSFLAAGASFYAALALFPVTLVLLSVFGWLLSSSEYVQEWRVQFLDLITERTSEGFSQIVSTQLDNIQQNTGLAGSLGILTLVAFSMAFFTNLERAFGKIWETPRESFGIISGIKRVVFVRLKAYLMMVLLVIFVAANFLANIILGSLSGFLVQFVESESFWSAVQTAEEIALNAILFACIYQIMTREKIKWRHAIIGGFLAALLWQPGRYLIATYMISDRYTAFGIVGAFWGVLLWIYYGIHMILFGATYVYAASQENREPI